MTLGLDPSIRPLLTLTRLRVLVLMVFSFCFSVQVASAADSEALVSPPASITDPGPGKRVDVYYRGLRDLLPARLNLPDPESIENVWIEVAYKGRLPAVALHKAISARIKGGKEVQLTPNKLAGEWGSSGVGSFSGEIGPTDRINLNFEVEEKSAQSVIVYVVRSDGDPSVTYRGAYSLYAGYHSSTTVEVPLADDRREKQIKVTIPLTELSANGGALDFVVTAGTVTKGFRRIWEPSFRFDNECCVDTVQVMLDNVNAGAREVSVTVNSPKGNPDGQTFMVSGIVLAEISPSCAPLTLDIPTDVCTDNSVAFTSVSPGPGYTVTYDFGEHADPRTHTGFGKVFVMYDTEGEHELVATVSGPDCRSVEKHTVSVNACNESTCALEGANVLQHPAYGNQDGVIELDMCVSCGSSPPYRISYTYRGKDYESGPFDRVKPRLEKLAAGTYERIYVTDANGCQTNVTGPVTLCNGGCGQSATCLDAVCTLTGFRENGRKRVFWLLGFDVEDPRWQWENGTGDFVVEGEQSARITGRIVSIEDPTAGFEVNLVLRKRRSWTDWSALGRGWKGSRERLGNGEHKAWDYYELAPDISTFKGFGRYSGTLTLQPRPADLSYGVQVGQGANDQNLSPGISAWFAYSGTLNGKTVSGVGDINAEGTCRLSELRKNAVPIIACAEDFAVACGRTIEDAPEPTINCGTPDDYTLSYEDREMNGTPRKIERTWTATGPGGPATCKQTISFGDDQGPVFTEVPFESTMSCTEVKGQTATAEDACGEVEVTVVETRFNESCPGNYDLRRVWTATDESGNTATAEAIVHVVDTQGPTFTSGPEDIVIDCGDELPKDNVTTADDCGGNVNVKYSVSACTAATPVYRFAEGGIEYLPEVKDPGLSYGAGMQGLAIEGVCSDAPAQRRRWEVSNPNAFPVYVSSVSAGSEVIYEGIVVPAQSRVYFFTPGSGGAKLSWNDASGTERNATGTPTDAACEGELSAAETCACVYERTWTAKDDCGNVSTYVQKVWERDDRAPVLQDIPADRSYVAGSAVPGPPNVTAKDRCGEATVRYGEVTIPSSEYPCDGAAVHYLFGYNSVGHSVLELNGRVYRIGKQPLAVQELCEGRALVRGILVDATNPTARFEVKLELEGRRSFAEHQAAGGAAEAAGCGASDQSKWTFYQLDPTNSTLTGSGANAGVNLALAPVGGKWLQLGPGANAANCKNGFFGEFRYTATSGVFAGDRGVWRGSLKSVELPASDAGCKEGYTLIRIWTATDDCGNQAIERQAIRVEDAEAPRFVDLPDNITVDCADPVPAATAKAEDNADLDVKVEMEEAEAGDECSRTITRRWTATDDCGNVSLATQVITVADQAGPTIAFTDSTLSKLKSGDLLVVDCGNVPNIDEGSAVIADNCDPNPEVKFTDRALGQGDCATNGYREKFQCTWTARDRCGNETVFVIFVEFRDEQGPVFAQVPEAITQTCGEAVPTAQPTVSDNCASNPRVVESSQTVAGACADSYQLIRIWTATDDCGNAATASQVVTISDAKAPTFANVPADATLDCSTPLPTDLPAVEDDCDREVRIVETQETQTNDCAGSYRLVRLFTATDNCGNSATASQVLIVEDETAPVLTFTAERLRGLSDGSELVLDCDEVPVFNASDVTAVDGCDRSPTVTVTETTPEIGTCATDGFARRYSATWAAVDHCGNTTSATLQIKVRDLQRPIIASLPGPVTVSCGQELPTSQPTITDNCTDAASLLVTEERTDEAGNCTDSYRVIRTWTATDLCGNVATGSQVITVRDELEPVLSDIPASLTVSCDAAVPADLPTATDNCDVEVEVSVDEQRRSGTCPGSYRLVRTFTATDNCGNRATASQVVTVQDLVAPVFADVPEAVSASCSDGVPGAQPTATDNCDANPAIVETSQPRPGACPDSYELVRTWTATDHCGNVATATQVVTFSDTEAPTLASLPQNITIRCDEPLPTDRPVATDGCDRDVNVSESQTREAGACDNGYVVTRLFTATDNCGNQTTATQLVTVVDDVAPEFIALPANVAIACDEPLPAKRPTAQDNCDGQVEVTETQDTRPGNCGGGYDLVRTFSATDRCGNVATASQVVSITDGEAPLFTYVPADVAIACEEEIPTEAATVRDACDTAAVIVENQTIREGACAGTYEVVRTFTATDNCGNSATASQVVSVFDATKPVFANVPVNVSVSCNEALPTAEPSVSDNCDTDVDIVLDEARQEGSCPQTYRLLRRWTATDHCGNVATASQVVTVQDGEAPVFADVPADLELSCSQALPTGQPTLSDLCDDDVEVVETERVEPGACANSYRVVRVWTSCDACGNVSTAEQVITLTDREAPTFADVPASITLTCDEPLPSVGPQVTDNCDEEVAINEVQERRDGACANSYELVRTWTATDACGNSSTASQVVIVGDERAPLFAFVPSEVTVDCDAPMPADQVEVSDNCDPSVAVTESRTETPGDCPGSRDVVRTWTASDACGNVATASQLVHFRDSKAPVFEAVPALIAVQCDDALPVTQPTVVDDCDADFVLTEAQTTEPDSCAGAYTVVRTWTATDACGNVSTATQAVKVRDTEPPVFTQVPTSVSLSCDGELPTELAAATDNCAAEVAIVETEERVAGNCPGSYVVTRIFTATDECGNATTASQVVTFQDRTPPVFAEIPAAVTIECDASLPLDAPTVSDNCDATVAFTEAQSTTPGACENGYTVLRVWTATDVCGNRATASQVVTIEDTQAPIFASVPAETTIECSDELPAEMATATDLCDPEVAITVSDRTEPGDCADSYLVIRTFTAMDACGNRTTAEQRVNVRDTQAPTFVDVPQEITVSCDEDLPTVLAKAEDNCDAQVVVVEEQTTEVGSCPEAYTVVRRFTATDNCGNTATAEQRVNVRDTEAPSFVSVPVDVTIACDAPVPSVAAVANDNCDQQVTVTEAQTTEAGDCAEGYTIVRTWTATDDCGNTATAEQRVRLTDEVAPAFASVPDSVTIGCNQPLPTDVATATDNCTAEVTITVEQATEPGECAGSYQVIRTFTATDGCGNTATASQVVRVEDTNLPVLADVPAAVVLTCDATLPTDAPTATDGCDERVDVVETQEYLTGECGGSYRVIRVWTATDDCGNTASATQLVTVQDNVAPVLANVPAERTLTCADVLPSELPTATDNCDADVHVGETQQRMPGGCADSYTLVRTFTTTDECGNASTASQIVTVEDVAGPSLAGVPTDVSISCADTIPTTQPTATDACDGAVSIVEATETIAGGCPGTYQLVRTWTASDNCGNTVQATQTVSVSDGLAPVFTDVPTEVDIAGDGELPTDQPTATDECDPNVIIVETSDTTTVGCADNLRITRLWTATDDCGNVATATQIVNVTDETAPEFVSVPPAVTVSCGDELPTSMPRARDNCAAEVGIEERTQRKKGACANTYDIVRIWTAADACGNTATASQVVTFEDSTPPAFADVPMSRTITCDEPRPDEAPTASDDCAKDVKLRMEETTVDGACDASYELVRTWTASDACGNSATVSQIITVIDPTMPAFVQVPPDASVSCDAGLPKSQPTTSDNCDKKVVVTETQETLSGACPDSYVVLRTWTISDDCGNSDRATQRVTVTDDQAPTFKRVPSSTTLACGQAPRAADVTAVDNCDDDVTVTMTEAREGTDCTTGVRLIRTWTATDNCGNATTTSQTITFEDREAPSIADLEQKITVSCEQPIPVLTPTASDNCDRDVNLEFFDKRREQPCGYEVARTWVATDDCGNSKSSVQTITVSDSRKPVLVGVPADLQLGCGEEIPAASVTATDNCDASVTVSTKEEESAGRCAGERRITRTFTATDACGNVASAVQVINIDDATSPALTDVPASRELACGAALPTALPKASDACGGTAPEVSVSERTESGACANTYRVVRLFTATDACGNTATASQVVFVSDTIAPRFTDVPAAITVSCRENVPSAEATATDDCDERVRVVTAERNVAGECGSSYELVRTFTATDACGNVATATQVVTVIDDTAPVFANVPRDVEVGCGQPLPNNSPTASDDCSRGQVRISMLEDRVGEPGAAEYQLTRTWTAADECGNTASVSQTITVFGEGKPVFTFVPEDARYTCQQTIPSIPARAVANCNGEAAVTLDEERTEGDCADSYTLVRTWTARDAKGNAATARQTIRVEDREAPRFKRVPADITLACGDAMPEDMATAADNCDSDVAVTVDEQRRTGDCSSTYSIERTFRATDDCGNSVTARQVITFADEEAPVFTFVPDSEEYACSIGQPREKAKATDNCTSNVTVSYADRSPSVDCSERLQRVWTATDDCGNVSTAVQFILLQDDENPTLSGVPPNIQVDIADGETVPAAAPVRGADNCDNNPQVKLTEESVPGMDCDYILVRTWEVTDRCGNSARGTQRISVSGGESIGILVRPSDDCAPEGIAVAASPLREGAVYTWKANGGTFSDSKSGETVFTPSKVGAYQLSLTVSGEGCAGQASQEVTVDRLSLSVEGATRLEAGDAIRLSASAGAEGYSWTGPQGFSAKGRDIGIPNASPAMSGAYVLTAKYASCSQEVSTSVTIVGDTPVDTSTNPLGCAFPSPDEAQLQQPRCGQSDGSITFPTLPFAEAVYTWTPQVASGASATNLAAGKYRLRVSDAEGSACAKTYEFVLNAAPEVNGVKAKTSIVRAQTDDACLGPDGALLDLVLVTAPSVPDGYALHYILADASGGEIVETSDAARFSVSGSGQYSVHQIVYDPSNFTPDDMLDAGRIDAIDEQIAAGDVCAALTTYGARFVARVCCEAPVVSTVNTVDAGCDRPSGSVNVKVVGDPADYSYRWLPERGTPQSDAGNARKDLPAGTYTIRVTRPGAADCATEATATVGVSEVVAGRPTVVFADCGVSNGQVDFPNAAEGVRFTWPDGLSAAKRADLAAGTYIVTASQTDASCNEEIAVSVGARADFGLSAEVLRLPACGAADGAVRIEASRRGNYTYDWGTGAERENLAAGAYNVLVTDRESGCSETLGFVLTDGASATATISMADTTALSCYGAQDGAPKFEPDYAAGFAYPPTISFENSRGEVVKHGELGAGEYCLLIRDANGCLAGTRCFTVVEPRELSVDAQISGVDCERAGGSISLSLSGGSAPFKYDWQDLPAANDPRDRTELAVGQYEVKVTDAAGCVSQVQLLEVGSDCDQGGNRLPVAIDDETATTHEAVTTIDVIANDTINGLLEDLSWVTQPEHGSVSLENDGVFRYVPTRDFCGDFDSFSYAITNESGADTATVRIEVACDKLVIFSGFSPNGDNVNDQFTIVGIESFPRNKVIVFNRWGNQVYERDGYANDAEAFQGRWKGKTLPEGSYYYVITDGAGETYSGYLQLAR